MILIIGIGIGYTRKQILETFTGQQVAVDQGFLAELRQIGIARIIGFNRETTGVDLLAVAFRAFFRSSLRSLRHGARQSFASFFCDQLVRAFVLLVHRYRLRGLL